MTWHCLAEESLLFTVSMAFIGKQILAQVLY